MRRDLLTQLNDARRERRAAVLVTALEGGKQRFVTPETLVSDPLADELDAALRAGKSRLIEQDGKSYFLTVQVPPVRLVVIGAVHIRKLWPLWRNSQASTW